jgi:hypothetical protein
MSRLLKTVARPQEDDGVDHVRWPAWGSIETWCYISGMSRRATYEGIATKELEARKDGTKTIINIEAGLKRMAALPLAKIKPMKQR